MAHRSIELAVSVTWFT